MHGLPLKREKVKIIFFRIIKKCSLNVVQEKFFKMSKTREVKKVVQCVFFCEIKFISKKSYATFCLELN